MRSDSAEYLRSIKTFPQLVKYLRDKLDWPIDKDDFDELTFDYDPEELGIDAQTAVKIKEIKQLRPLTAGQPWGIFFINFEPKNLPVVALRRILSKLVVKKRTSANRAKQPSWELHDLLFISSYGESAHRDITFAHFSEDPDEPSDLPTLRVLQWDDEDTVAHLEHAHDTLRRCLSWPDNSMDINEWRETWAEAFTLRHKEVISTSKGLAVQLAKLATAIRKRVNKVLAIESEKGPMRKLMAAFKEALIHDLSEDDFADMYAQTITYGLLSARVSRPAGIVAENIAEMVPVTNPFLRDLLSTFLTIGGRKGKLDFDELGINDVIQILRLANMEAVLLDFGDKNPQEDPVIHFYELFLKEYDPKKRMKRGVFYTPRSVVSFIVRSVDEILRKEFGLTDGLADTTTWGEMAKRHSDLEIPKGAKPADPFVQILDPACGTGTFLVEVIDIIHKTMLAKWRKKGRSELELTELWNEYVSDHLLPRIYGFELMMAPYAIAHMKIGLKLGETGYKFLSHERARIYLTNTLEEPTDFPQQILFDAPALAHEAEAVNAIKRNQRFTVVIGNPPYAGVSSNMTKHSQQLVNAYKIVDGQALNERKLWLQDDYVKFIRKAQMILEQTHSGILGYITNHGYIDNPTFRGMRRSLIGSFQRIRVFDLHGNANKREKSPDGTEDKNIFDIRQGVAICIAARGNQSSFVQHKELWGTREAKYAWLTEHSLGDTSFVALLPSSPYYLFKPQKTDYRVEYDKGWRINEAMPVNSAGFITARDHFVVDIDKDALLKRIADFADPHLSDGEIRRRFFGGYGSAKYPDGDTRGWKVTEARKRVRADREWRERVTTCFYRPFDRRVIYWADWMVDWPRPDVMGHMMAGPNLALHVCRQSVSEQWAHVLVTTGITDDCYVSNKTRERGYTHPLYVYRAAEGLQFSNTYDTNFSPAFLRVFRESLEVAAQPNESAQGVTAEDVFHYIYAVFHSPGYRSRYAEFLTIDFPRVPLTGSLELFSALTKLGNELATLHLMESPLLEHASTIFVGPESPEVGRIVWSDDTVWIDAPVTRKGKPAQPGTIGFRGVPEEVWNFHIGGYQVCEKWLKDRKGRTLSAEDIEHYKKIVKAISETIRLMTEIDKVIEKHGGWPGAFVAEAAKNDK